MLKNLRRAGVFVITRRRTLNPETLSSKTLKTLNPKAENTAVYRSIFCNFSSHLRRQGILNVAVWANHGIRTDDPTELKNRPADCSGMGSLDNAKSHHTSSHFILSILSLITSHVHSFSVHFGTNQPIVLKTFRHLCWRLVWEYALFGDKPIELRTATACFKVAPKRLSKRRAIKWWTMSMQV